MSLSETLETLKIIHKSTIKYIDYEDNSEESYVDLINQLNDQKFHENKYKLKLYLQFLSDVIDNHYRANNFYEKIKKIIMNYKSNLKIDFSNSEIFNIFKNNKVILLFLIKEQILTIDNSIIDIILSERYSKMDYPKYFLPEIMPFLTQKQIESFDIQINDDFEKNRKIGENENYICELIRNDNIEDFISHVKKTNLKLNKLIDISIFESNQFLIGKNISIIEYATFFGSIQIFNYLYKNNATIKPSIWLYAIHSDNPELIHVLEENQIEYPEEQKKNKSYRNYNEYDDSDNDEKNDDNDDNILNCCIFESIKCHHNDISNYLSKKSSIEKFDFSTCLKYHNFEFIQIKNIGNLEFYKFCKYDYPYIVEMILKEKDIDINYAKISNLNKKVNGMFLTNFHVITNLLFF